MEMRNLFSCNDIGWCCLKKNIEAEIEVDQGEKITYQSSCAKGFQKNKDNYMERANCFFIMREKKKENKIKRITIRKTPFYFGKFDKEERQLLIEDMALQLQVTEQSIIPPFIC